MSDIHNPGKTPSKADYKRYKTLLQEVHSDIDAIDIALRRVTRNLKAIHDRKLFLCGGYTSFGEFCTKELGKSRQQAYNLLQAHEVIQNLLESGVAESDLPPTERLCREIRRMKDPEEQTRVWRTVTRIAKERGTQPAVRDVQAELEAKGHPSAIDRQQMELVQKFEGMERAMHKSFRFDVLDPPFRKRLLAALQRMAQTIDILLKALESPAVESRAAITES